MNPFHGLYTLFITKPGGIPILILLDILILAGSMVGSALYRSAFFGSLQLGMDLVMGFLIGFTLLISLNSLVYIGSLSETSSQENR